MAKSATEELKNKYNAAFAQSASDDPAKTLWDSLSYGYGKKADQINASYNKALSQQDNAMLKRGMGRSSYALQSMANLNKERNAALASNEDALIADWQDRLTQMEEAEKARKFQTSEREAQQEWQSGENALNRSFQTSEREAQQLYNTGEREAQQLYNTGEREAQQAWQSGENALNRAQEQEQFAKTYGLQRDQFNESKRQYEQNFNYQKSRDAVSDSQWNQTFNYQKERDAVSDNQWNQSFGLQKDQFAYTQSSDERNYYASWVQNIAANGGEASDDMLAKAGISRADFEAMKAQAAAATGGGGGGSYSPKSPTTPAVTDDSFFNALNGNSMVSALNGIRNNTYTPKSDQLVGQGSSDALWTTGSAYGDKMKSDWQREQSKKNK